MLPGLIQKLMPNWLHHHLIGNWDQNGFKRYFHNTSWIAIAKIISLIVSFLTITIIAKYLGPENFGKLSYAQNFVALFSAFASIGIDQILLRELVANKDKEKELLGTAFILKLCFGLATFTTTLITALFLNSDPILTWMIGIIALTFIFQPFGVIGQLFNALVLSKFNSYVSIAIAFLIPGLKLLIVYFDKGILFISATIAVESAIYAVAYYYLYKVILNGRIFDWKPSYIRALHLLRDSWPLLLVSLSGYIYGRIDQVMIQQYLNSSAVGLYDIAVRLTELLGFIPGVIIASLFPALVNAKKTNQGDYLKRFRYLTILCISISILSSIILYLIAPLLIKHLFGEGFLESISITHIYVWSTIGTVSIIIIQQYFIIENRPRLFLLFSIFSAICNIVLNYLLIPKYGTYGAAVATLITMMITITIFIMTKNAIFKNNNL